MAWEARLGLKRKRRASIGRGKNRLNGLGSPSGIETRARHHARGLRERLNGLGSPSGIETLAFRSHHAGYVHGLNGLGSPSGGRKFSQDWHSWLYESALVFVDVRFVASEEASEYVARREDGD